MSKIKKFAALEIRKITGGKDPLRLIEEFIIRQGMDPQKSIADQSPDGTRWVLNLGEEEELEIIAEGMNRPSETTIYMGVNIATVPLKGSTDVLITALEVADGLIGVKLSLVGHYLVLSSSFGVSGMSIEDIEYFFALLTAQKAWFKETLAQELGWSIE